MHILEFANEILLNICARLHKNDLFQISLTNRRLSALALEILYEDVKVDCSFADPQQSQLLDQFCSTLQEHPERASLVRKAYFSWPSYASNDIKEKIFDLLPKLFMLNKLHLREQNTLVLLPVTNLHRIAPEKSPTQLVLSCPAVSSIRCLRIADWGILGNEIFELLVLRKLNCLHIEEFNGYLSDETSFHLLDNVISNIEVLEFSNSSPPAGPTVIELLRPYRELRELTWIMASRLIRGRLSPRTISCALSCMQMTLAKLHLSTTHFRQENDGTYLNLQGFAALKV